MHTHLFHQDRKDWRKASFGIFQSLSSTFDFMPFIVVKPVPLRSIFRIGNSQKSLGVQWFSDDRNVLLNEELPCSKRCVNCITQPLQNLQVTLCQGGMNSWCTKPSMSKNSGNLLTTPCRSRYMTT
jgi:hypothetical protein